MPNAAVRAHLAEAVEGKAAIEAVRGLLHVLSHYPSGSCVELSDGSVAQVLRPTGEDFGQPVVQVRTASDGSPRFAADETSVGDLRESELSVVRAQPSRERTELDIDPRFDVREAYFRELLDLTGNPAKTEPRPGARPRTPAPAVSASHEASG